MHLSGRDGPAVCSALVARAQGGIRDVRLYGKTLLVFARATSIKLGISCIVL
jgi:hypothetical protein